MGDLNPKESKMVEKDIKNVEGGFVNHGADLDDVDEVWDSTSAPPPYSQNTTNSNTSNENSDNEGGNVPFSNPNIAEYTNPTISQDTLKDNTGSTISIESSSVSDADSGDSNPKKARTILGYTKRQFFLVFAFCLCNFASLACSSLHAPFFPKVATSKGASNTASGFVFGIFQLTVFIMSLVYGSLLGKIGPKRMATTGIIVMALGSIVFGFLDYLEDATSFITLSFIVRIIQANGNAGFVTASFAIIANEFPTSVAKAISYMETAAGLGLIVGPAVGGGLYEVGGFIVPFIVMGTLLLIAGIVAFFYMPDVIMPENVPIKGEDGRIKKPPGMLTLLSIPTVTLAAFSIFAGASAIGYLLPTLEPHVDHNFDLPASFTGLVFIIDGAMYALFNPLWGALCDIFKNPRLISLIGSFLIFGGFMIIGPVTFLPWSPILWVTCVGCAIFGLGLGATFVSGFVQALVDAKKRGFPDNVGTLGLVSGMWFSMMSLGCFVGASAGGALLEYYGFQNGIYFVLALQIVVTIGTVTFMYRYRNENANEENPEGVANGNVETVKA